MPLGLSDNRLRLAYLHQHREWAVAALFCLGLTARLLGWPLSNGALEALGVWCLLALLLLRAALRAPRESVLLRLTFAYCGLEACLITALALAARAPAWLALLFGFLPVCYAAMLLGRGQARLIAALAAVNFGLFLRWQNAPAAPRSWDLVIMLAVAAVVGYGLVASTLALFSAMLCSQAAALQSANHELMLHRTHLADLVLQRTRDLQQTSDRLLEANANLVRLNRVKDCFLANVSHELRTPLTSIRACAEVLLDIPADDAPVRAEFAAMIRDETDRLSRLINDLLDLAAIQAGGAHFHPQPVSLPAVVRESVGLMRALAQQKGLRLHNRIPARLPLILAEPDRLHQVLTNLLSNAVKFTGHGSIEVSAHATLGEVILQVRDTGEGIAASDFEAVFDKFFQAGHPLTGKPAGTGLGLAICREIMARHGGRIWVESRLGEGSAFFCSFPRATDQHHRSLPTASSAAA
ncbi:MAG: sensor histidine kinase [Terriglobales bacterium]